MKRTTALIICVMMSGGLMSTAFSQETTTPPSEVSEVSSSPNAQNYQVPVSLYSDQTATLASLLDGVVEKINLRDGQHFKRDDTLLQFDCTVFKAQEDKDQARVTRTQAELNAKERLFKLGGLNKIEVAQAKADFQEANASLKTSEYYANHCSVKAPFDGQVSDVFVHQHEMVKKGDKLMQVVSNDNLKLRLFVPSSWVSWLKVGAKFKVNLRETGQAYTAQVLRMVDQVEAVSRSVKIIAKIDNPDANLYAGMSGEATFQGPTDG